MWRHTCDASTGMRVFCSAGTRPQCFVGGRVRSWRRVSPVSTLKRTRDAAAIVPARRTAQVSQPAAARIELLRSHDQSYRIVLRLWFYWLLLNFYGLIGCREQLENNARIIHGEQIQMVARGVFRVSQTTTTTKRWEISLQRFNKSFYLSSPCCKQRCCYVCPSHSGLFIVYLRKTYHRYPSIRFTRPTA